MGPGWVLHGDSPVGRREYLWPQKPTTAPEDIPTGRRMSTALLSAIGILRDLGAPALDPTVIVQLR